MMAPSPQAPLVDVGTSVLAGLIGDLPDAVVVVDDRGVVRYANPAVARLLGHDPAALVGGSYEVLVPAEVRGLHAAHRSRFLSTPSVRPMGAALDLHARRADGTTVPVEIALVPLREPAGMVAAIIGAASVRRRLQEQVSATNQLVTAMLEGRTQEEALRLGARLGAELLDADAMVALLEEGDSRLVVAAAHGPHGTQLAGRSVPVGATMLDQLPDAGVRAIDAPATSACLLARTDPPPQALMAARITYGGACRGTMAFGRTDHDRDFDPVDTEIASRFVDSLTLAMAVASARRERDELARMAEHDRIAKDLHDSVIQRIFAVGLRLESAAMVSDGPARERVGEAVAELDEAIAEIRSTIFNLQGGRAGGLRSRIGEEVDRAAGMLGWSPRLRIDGAADLRVTEPTQSHVLAVIREALANVARHAQASAAEVLVVVDDRVVVRVSDDGVGMAPGPSAGNGLANLRARAEAAGGALSVRRRDGGGTTLEWAVPL